MLTTKGNLKLLALKVVAYKKFQIQEFDLETFGILENWSLRRGGPLPLAL